MYEKEIKQVGYAYFSSDIAEMLGRGDSGCHYVEIGDPWKSGDIYGPFDTIEEAESAAEPVEVPWLGRYLDHPLRGSQFSLTQKGND